MSNKYQVNDHSVLKVTKEEAKQGKSWHDIARRRARSQHGENEEIPEGDIHAVKKFDSNLHIPTPDPHETSEAVNELEEKIKRLQMGEEEKARLRKQQQQHHQPPQHHNPQNFEDDLDDWFK